MNAPKELVYQYTAKDSIEVKTLVDGEKVITKVYDYSINEDKNFSIKTQVYLMSGEIAFVDMKSGDMINGLVSLDEENKEMLKGYLAENDISQDNPQHARLLFEKNKDEVQNTANKGDGQHYGVSFVIEEEQSKQEYKTFLYLTLFTVAFGLLLIAFLKKLKKLTHGAEEIELADNDNYDETEGFEVADKN
jgi:hypothetical protein